MSSVDLQIRYAERVGIDVTAQNLRHVTSIITVQRKTMRLYRGGRELRWSRFDIDTTERFARVHIIRYVWGVAGYEDGDGGHEFLVTDNHMEALAAYERFAKDFPEES